MSLVEALERMGHGWVPQSVTHPAYPLQNAKRHGDLVYVSGQVPFMNGQVVSGKVGDTVKVGTAAYAAELCAVYCLYAAGALVEPEGIVGVVQMTVYVNCAPGFTDTSRVANGASNLLIAALGEAGRCARTAVGVAELPLDAAVEITMIVTVR